MYLVLKQLSKYILEIEACKHMCICVCQYPKIFFEILLFALIWGGHFTAIIKPSELLNVTSFVMVYLNCTSCLFSCFNVVLLRGFKEQDSYTYRYKAIPVKLLLQHFLKKWLKCSSKKCKQIKVSYSHFILISLLKLCKTQKLIKPFLKIIS